MKTLNVLLSALVIIFILCQCTVSSKEKESKTDVVIKDGLFLHVSSGYDNPHKASMALSLAVKMAESKDVAMFFDTEGVKLLTKNSKDIQMSNFLTLHSALDSLVQNNVTLMVCPMCLAQAEIEPEQLREGVMIAEKERFFNFTQGRILTIDY